MNTTTVKRDGIYITFPSMKDVLIKREKDTPIIERIEVQVEKKCIHCGASSFNSSSYCWDGYKYEYFETR